MPLVQNKPMQLHTMLKYAVRLRSAESAALCKHRGALIDKTPCGGEVYACKKRGTCSLQPQTCENGMALCLDCHQYAVDDNENEEQLAIMPELPERDPIRFDQTNLDAESGGVRLNGSMIPYKDGYLFAYRNSWGDSSICVHRLTKDFAPCGRRKLLGLNHAVALAGKEDPRLFWHRGKPHVWFTGWMGENSTATHLANVLYARLHPETFATEEIIFPAIPNRNRWEKNHAYFDASGKLCMVYNIRPHIVMEVQGNRVVNIHTTPTASVWRYGHQRGGASPVLHRDEFYHFFHGMREINGTRLYSVGVAVFESKPPYRITRITQTPLDVADVRTNPRGPYVVFPGGAFYQDGYWIVTMGVHDKWTEVRFYAENRVEQLLERIA